MRQSWEDGAGLSWRDYWLCDGALGWVLGCVEPLTFLLNLPYPSWLGILTGAVQPNSRLIPKSNTSIKELDQAVALFAGATVLGFSLYSTADAYYQAWLSKTRATTQQRDIELGTLSRIQAPRR